MLGDVKGSAVPDRPKPSFVSYSVETAEFRGVRGIAAQRALPINTRKAVWLRRLPRSSKRLGRQILPVERDHGALAAFRIVDYLKVQLEVNRANDPVAEFFMDQRL